MTPPELELKQRMLEQKIYAQLEQWQQDVEARHLIEKNFPEKTLKRRSCGYAIDEAIDEWCLKTGIGRDGRSRDEMLDFIGDYEYDDDDVYYYIHPLIQE